MRSLRIDRLEMSLPARFHNAWDHSIVRHLAEAEARKFELLQNTTGTTSELAAAAEAHRRRIFRHFIECHLRCVALFLTLVHIEDDLFETLTLVPFELNEAFALLLFCNPGFCCHISLISLLFTSRTFLSLLAVWIRFIDHVNAALAAYNFVPFGRIGFDRSSYFHDYLKKEN